MHNLLYDHFVAAVTRVHPRLRVGGPAMWTAALGQFLEHVGRGCDQVSGGPVRIDYVSSHRYAMSADETRNFPLVFPYVGDLDREHGNTFRAWEAMGRPPRLAPEQLAELRSLERPRRHAGGIGVEAGGGRRYLTLRLPAQSVSLLEIPAAA